MTAAITSPGWPGLRDDARGAIEREALPDFLRRQRWFAAKTREIAGVGVVDSARPEGFPESTALLIIEVRFRDGEPELYFLPVTIADGPRAEALLREAPGRVIARFDAEEGGRLWLDGMADPDVCQALLRAIEEGWDLPTLSGSIHASPTSAFGSARGPAGSLLEATLSKAEQSNSAVLFDHRLILKVFRRLQPGINPDFEIGLFLTERTGFDRIPRTAGAIEYRRPGEEPTTLAILQELVRNQGTGWDHALHDLRGFYERVSRRPEPPDDTLGAGLSYRELASQEPPAAVKNLIGVYLAAAARLGRRTAEMHRALASHNDDPAFTPEPLTKDDLGSLESEIEEVVAEALNTLRTILDTLPEHSLGSARHVLDGAEGLTDRLDALAGLSSEVTKIRVHGDYHLGQVLRADDDFVILDFEGEPLRTIEERRRKQSPIKDVVGMLRSFDYAAYAALFEFTLGRPDEFDRLEPWAPFWQAWCSAAFLREYRAASQDSSSLPGDPAAFSALLDAFTLDKALYELLYELNNRPTWVGIPLQGIEALMEGERAEEVIPAAVPETRPGLISASELSDFDLYLLAEGTHYRSFEKLGAHLTCRDGVDGTSFAVWAPGARAVSVIGDFNAWDAEADPIHPRGQAGIWERFVPGVGPGTSYLYAVVSAEGKRVDKADPYGFAAELRPATSSKVVDLSAYEWGDLDWLASRRGANGLEAPISIYEVHLGSWMRVPEEGDRWLSYREVTPRLVDYAREMGFTHVEFLPLAEHPFDGSWGYQHTGYFAPTSRFGAPQDFMFLVDSLHQAGIGVILDWVPAHFPNDEHGLGRFDGAPLYEHADPRKGLHKDWNTYIFDYGRPEVVNFLVSNALFWLEKYHIDGLRVDAVASMLYLDYSRAPGEWVPNEYGGRENLEAIAFLRRLNERVHAAFPDVLTFAEESTAWPMVSRPTNVGGLGFDLKWDLGWMHDSLRYMGIDPLYRKHHHNDLSFRGLYAFSENFVLPLSHDEIVYGKGSLIEKMPGDAWRKFANLRLLLGWQFALPGKKLLFMGDEFAQWREWHHDRSLDWHLLSDPRHAGLRRWVRDLNTLYRAEPALHQLDCHPDGFSWADVHDADQSVISLFRKGRSGEPILIVANFTPIPRENYRIGVPSAGFWEEILNGDAEIYGGSGQGNIGGVSTAPVFWHGQGQSINLTLPPLAVLALRHRG